MSVSISVGSDTWELGSSDFVHAFFSTIAARIEDDRWGERFPQLMRGLYGGDLRAERVVGALAELDRVERELQAFGPSAVVWDFEDRRRLPPWGDEIAPGITSLANYFVTSGGIPLIDVLRSALLAANDQRQGLRIT
jgi:2,3-bisphosphoglycerate-dependent phosphoglycerate mutase